MLRPRFAGSGIAQMHNASMSVLPKTLAPEIAGHVIRIQALTLVWMSVEAVVSLGAARFARSPAPLGFGGDSAVELLSAAVVLWRFCSPSRGERSEQLVSCKNRRWLALCSRSICCPPFCSDIARARRSPAKSDWNRTAHHCCRSHALARMAKATALSGNWQRSVEG